MGSHSSWLPQSQPPPENARHCILAVYQPKSCDHGYTAECLICSSWKNQFQLNVCSLQPDQQWPCAATTQHSHDMDGFLSAPCLPLLSFHVTLIISPSAPCRLLLSNWKRCSSIQVNAIIMLQPQLTSNDRMQNKSKPLIGCMCEHIYPPSRQ